MVTKWVATNAGGIKMLLAQVSINEETGEARLISLYAKLEEMKMDFSLGLVDKHMIEDIEFEIEVLEGVLGVTY